MILNGAEIRNFYGLTRPVPQTNSGNEAFGTALIPLYQRPYRWDKENINKLVTDFKNNGNNHYFSGAVVTVNVNNNTQTSGIKHQIIDGQQRFTTLFLTNYLIYLISRAALHESIKQKSINTMFFVDSLIKSATYLFSAQGETALDNPVKDQFEQFKNSVRKVFLAPAATDLEEKIKNLLEELCEITGLPDITKLDRVKYGSPEYLQSSESNLDKILQNKTLKLRYSRNSFNKNLASALANCTITISSQTPTELVTPTTIDDSDLRKSYIDAIETLFNSFKLGHGGIILQQAQEEIEALSTFLENLRMCLVQTGGEKDAYTLFEVLNDRSAALAPLELMKNQIYKTFVIKNNNMNSQNIDNELLQADYAWTDQIFDSQTSQQHTDLIHFFAITFLSGSQKSQHKDNSSVRDALNEFLSEFLDHNKSFGTNELETTINAFICAKKFLELMDIKQKSKVQKALEDLNNTSASELEKTTSYLMAKQYEGVLVGLFCHALTGSKCAGNKKLDPTDFIRYLINEKGNPKSQINEVAKKLWRWAMVCKDWNSPRAKAKELINHNNFGSTATWSSLSNPGIAEYDEFDEFWNIWRYKENNQKNNLPAKYMFIYLLQLERPSGQLQIPKLQNSLTKKQMQSQELDHLEPGKIGLNTAKYFQNTDRKSIINSIGNMMLLPGGINGAKGNAPFEIVKHAFNASAWRKHFLAQDTLNIFAANNTMGVPTADFFTRRKELLKQVFKEAVQI